MEMMRLLLLLAAATRAKELSFGRDGVELFRRVFDEDALERLRRAWDAVEANETMVQSEVLEEGCVEAVARTTAASDPGHRVVIAARLDRSVAGDARGPVRWDEPLVDGQRRLVEVVRTPLDDITHERAALEVWPGTFLERDRRALRLSAVNASITEDDPVNIDDERLDASLEDHIKRLSGKTIPQRAGDVLVLRPEVWRRRRAHRDDSQQTRTLVCVVVREGDADGCAEEPCGATPLGRLLGLLEADEPPHEDDGDLWRALRNGTRRSVDDANATALVEFVRRVHAVPSSLVLVEAVGAHAPRLAVVLNDAVRRIVVARPTAAALACAELDDAVCVSSVEEALAALADVSEPVLLAVHGDASLGEELLTEVNAEQVWLVGERGVPDQLKRAAEARTCAHPTPRGAPLSHIRASVECASGIYGQRELVWKEGRINEGLFGAVGYFVAHDVRLTAPCPHQEVMGWPGWSSERALERFTGSIADVQETHARACRAWDALCASPALYGSGVPFDACYGLRGGYGPARAVACVVHTTTRTSLTTCAGRHVAYVADEEDVQEDEEPEVGALCHVGFGVAPSVAAWLHHNIAQTVVALAAPAPGLCADFGELGELELLRRLHPHKSVRAYSLNAPEAVVSAASQVSCDVVYVDLSSEHDHTSSKTARYFAKAATLFRNNASQLWLPRRVAVRPGIHWAKLEPRGGRDARCVNYAELRKGVLYPNAGRAGACASVAAPSWLRGGLDAYVYTGVAAVEPPPKQTSQPPASPSVKTARFVMVACDAASDPRRATEALVAMASAVASASPEADLSFYVLANGGAADELTKRIPRILALADERRVILRVTVGEIAWPAWLAEEAASHFKPCACVRLFLSELLPSDWNAGKVLYVDTDVLFVADPLQIYADAVASLNGGFVAAAAEHGDVVEPSADAYYNASGSHLPRAWLDDGANTGILALDLDRARSTNLSAWLVDARKALDDSEIAVDFGDQGWLNALLGGAALYLPEAGRLPCALNFRTDFCHHDFLDAERCAAAPRLLHAPRGALHLDSIYATPAFRVLSEFVRGVVRGRDREAARADALAAYGALLSRRAASAPRCAEVAAVAADAARGWFPTTS